MSVIESIRGVLWARRHRPDQMAIVMGASHERFPPQALLRQAALAEEAGFDGVACSDHLTPWWVPGGLAPAHCGNAWVWLGAASQATSRIALGTGVTGVVHRYNPVVVAQQVATLEALAPGRAFLGVGSSEAMNEVPAGMAWPDTAEQLQRTAEALEIIVRLLDGETLDFQGVYFTTRGARLYDRPPRRPPVIVSAFHEQIAEVAGQLADGVWTLGSPTTAPAVIAAYRRGAEKAGREPGEIWLQALAATGEDDDAALRGSREWKPALVPELYTDDIHATDAIQVRGEDVSDGRFTRANLVSADPGAHVAKLRLLGGLGATGVVVVNASGNDPEGLIRLYGAEVLPRLRDGG